MMIRKYFLVLIVALCGCQRHENVVATVAGRAISAEEFAARYEKYLGKVPARDGMNVRKQILDNMINEILILDDVTRQGLDRDSAALRQLGYIRAQAILTGYAQHLTLDTMVITEAELQNEFRRYNTKVRARYVYASTEDSARALKEALEHGATFEMLAKQIFEDPGLANNGGDLGYFGWNEMEPPLEDIAFTQPVGILSDPVKLSMGYAVVKIEDRTSRPLPSELDYANMKDKLASAVQKRKIVNALTHITEEIRKNLNPVFNEETLLALYNAWPALIQGPAQQISGNTESRQPDLRPLRLVTLGEKEWTVGDFLNQFFETSVLQQRRVKTIDDLKTFIVGVATRKIIYQRALDRGMERDTVIQQQIKRETQEYLLKRWRSSVEDTVGTRGWDESLLRSQYAEKKNDYMLPPEVNVAEILVRKYEEALSLKKQAARGANFGTLAGAHSIRIWAARRGGELGFGSTSAYGIWGDTLLGASTGEIVGPLYVDPYYGVFKIIAKRPARIPSFEEIRDQIATEVASSQRRRTFASAVGRIRSNAKVVIHEDVLSNIMINQLN